jgi:hypothetical protein
VKSPQYGGALTLIVLSQDKDSLEESLLNEMEEL